MNDFKAAMLNYQDRVRKSFNKQGMMVHMGAEVSEVRPGFCEVELPNGLQVLQQHGLFHGGAIAAIVVFADTTQRRGTLVFAGAVICIAGVS